MATEPVKMLFLLIAFQPCFSDHELPKVLGPSEAKVCQTHLDLFLCEILSN